MKSRCCCETDDNYHRYGARGIRICNEWLNDFLIFRNWALNNGYEDNLTIHRVDNNGNYCPENCMWADNFIQMRNTRLNHKLTAFGETKCISEWLEDTRCKVKSNTTLLGRILVYKWDNEKALTTPPQNFKDIKNKFAKKYSNGIESKTITEWFKTNNCVVKFRTFKHRMSNGWNVLDALTFPPKSGKDYIKNHD